jgi:hypothetical protein
VLHSVTNQQYGEKMTREQERQVSKARREQRTDKQFQTQYSEQAIRAANDANLAYGFKISFKGAR